MISFNFEEVPGFSDVTARSVAGNNGDASLPVSFLKPSPWFPALSLYSVWVCSRLLGRTCKLRTGPNIAMLIRELQLLYSTQGFLEYWFCLLIQYKQYSFPLYSCKQETQ